MGKRRRCAQCNKTLTKKTQRWYCSPACGVIHRGWLRDSRAGVGKAPTSVPSTPKSQFQLQLEAALKAKSDALAKAKALKPKIVVIRDGPKSKIWAELKKKLAAQTPKGKQGQKKSK
jgi:hypothetical protein